MTRDDVIAEVHTMRSDASRAVRFYARHQCPHLTPSFVEALTGALGEISVEEAIIALDREESIAAAGGVR